DFACGRILRAAKVKRAFCIGHIVAPKIADVAVLAGLPDEPFARLTEIAVEADVAIGVGRVRAVTIDHLQLFHRIHATAAEYVCTERKPAKVGFVVAEHVVKESIKLGVAQRPLVRLIRKYEYPAKRKKSGDAQNRNRNSGSAWK